MENIKTTDIEVMILQSLAAGLSQKEVHEHLDKMGIKPNSVSYIEKAINKMKKEYRAGSLFHLALIVKRKGII